MNSKIDKFSNDELIKMLSESKSFREVLNRIGYCSNGSGGYTSLKNQLNKRNIKIPKYHYYGSGNKNQQYSLDDILIKNSTYTNRASLKRRLVNEGLLEYKCKCGNVGMWEGKELSLQLEHKNGINNDNRIENLEFLCPNCHSQSTTYGGKNNKCSLRVKQEKNKTSFKMCDCGEEIRKTSNCCSKCHNINKRKVKNRPSIETLKKDVELCGYSATGRKYGVSDNAIRKWLKY